MLLLVVVSRVEKMGPHPRTYRLCTRSGVAVNGRVIALPRYLAPETTQLSARIERTANAQFVCGPERAERSAWP